MTANGIKGIFKPKLTDGKEHRHTRAQTEQHVVKLCPMTAGVRHRYDFPSWAQVVAYNSNLPVDNIVCETLSIYKWKYFSNMLFFSSQYFVRTEI